MVRNVSSYHKNIEIKLNKFDLSKILIDFEIHSKFKKNKYYVCMYICINRINRNDLYECNYREFKGNPDENDLAIFALHLVDQFMELNKKTKRYIKNKINYLYYYGDILRYGL